MRIPETNQWIIKETQIFRTSLRVEATIDERRPQDCSSVRGFSQMVKSDCRFLHAEWTDYEELPNEKGNITPSRKHKLANAFVRLRISS